MFLKISQYPQEKLWRTLSNFDGLELKSENREAPQKNIGVGKGRLETNDHDD